jgi:cytochrome c biogenesis protein CcdA
MIDPVAAAASAVSGGDLARLPMAALAGVVTSVGPCVAPRYVAVAALLDGRRPYLTIAAFVGGMLVAYAALGLGVGVLGALTGNASVLYLALAAVLGCAGLKTLAQRPACAHAHGQRPVGARTPASGAFSLGAASAFVVSPCCTPVVAAVAGLTAFDGHVVARVLLLAAFALGHAAPLLLAAPGGALVRRALHAWDAGPAPAIVSGTLMLALGMYYGLLV